VEARISQCISWKNNSALTQHSEGRQKQYQVHVILLLRSFIERNILKLFIEKFIKLEILRESWEELKVCKTNLVLMKIIAFENA